MEAIITARLACFPFPVFDKGALRYCTHKCEAHGDVREVLLACEKALQALRSEVRRSE